MSGFSSGNAAGVTRQVRHEATGEVVYDNQMGEADNSNAGTELGGGNIATHRDKRK